MEHDDYLDDLSADFAAKLRAQRQVEATELSAADAAEVTLSGRLLASVGTTVEIQLINGESLRGEVADAAANWLILRLLRMDILIRYPAIEVVSSLGPAPRWPTLVEARIPGTVKLREFAATRREIQFTTRNQTLKGRIERVGADFVDIVDHGRHEAIALSALLYVSCPR